MDNFLSLLTKLAPSIAATIGGPLAGTGVAALESVFGLTPTPNESITQRTDDLASKVLSAPPDDLLRLKQADNAHAEAMAKLGFDNVQQLQALQVQDAQIAMQDRDSARAREEKLADKTNRNLAYLIVAAFITLVASTLLGYSHVESALAGTLVGYLSAKTEQVLAYYFGSSKGSDRKTELLSQAPAIDQTK